jgi:hypothetical protein
LFGLVEFAKLADATDGPLRNGVQIKEQSKSKKIVFNSLLDAH